MSTYRFAEVSPFGRPRPSFCPQLMGLMLEYAIRRTKLANDHRSDHTSEIADLKSKMGVFGWFLKCQTHGTDWSVGCLSCEMAAEHDYWIGYDIAMALGHLIEEPAGDVPMGGRREVA